MIKISAGTSLFTLCVGFTGTVICDNRRVVDFAMTVFFCRCVLASSGVIILEVVTSIIMRDKES